MSNAPSRTSPSHSIAEQIPLIIMSTVSSPSVSCTKEPRTFPIIPKTLLIVFKYEPIVFIIALPSSLLTKSLKFSVAFLKPSEKALRLRLAFVISSSSDSLVNRPKKSFNGPSAKPIASPIVEKISAIALPIFVIPSKKSLM